MGDAKYIKKHRERGLCIDCSNPAEYGIRCAKCNLGNKISSRKYYAKNREKVMRRIRLRKERLRREDKCIECGVELIEGENVRCVNCNLVTQGRVI